MYKPKQTSPGQKSAPKQQLVRPMIHVPPTDRTVKPVTKLVKPFYGLSSYELVERLKCCHMVSLAGICEREHFDGSFFKNVSDSELRKDFKLSPLDIVKFKKMKDENWVVNE